MPSADPPQDCNKHPNVALRTCRTPAASPHSPPAHLLQVSAGTQVILSDLVVVPFTLQMAFQHILCSTMRLESTVKALAECKLKHYRTSECAGVCKNNRVVRSFGAPAGCPHSPPAWPWRVAAPDACAPPPPPPMWSLVCSNSMPCSLLCTFCSA